MIKYTYSYSSPYTQQVIPLPPLCCLNVYFLQIPAALPMMIAMIYICCIWCAAKLLDCSNG